jgi:hypothetical protein
MFGMQRATFTCTVAERLDGPDPDPFPHDHPWTFWSFVFSGAYIEDILIPSNALREVWQKRDGVVRGLFSFHKMELGTFHRIRLLARTPTRTLVFAGPRRCSWGFLTNRGFMEFNDYFDMNPARDTRNQQ